MCDLVIKCSVCGESKNISEYKIRSDNGKPYGKCKACVSEYDKQRHRDNPRRRLEYNLRKYSLTLDEYDSMMLSQENRCAICSVVFSVENRPCVDHDHNCCEYGASCGKCVRGLLCSRCNTGIGKFNDDVALIQKAALYLVRPWE